MESPLESHVISKLLQLCTAASKMGGAGGQTPLDDSEAETWTEILDRAKARAFRGGLTGSAAQAINVLALMWMRTTMNYQMVNGGAMFETIRLLYAEGGVPRFYRGLIPALFGSPLMRFGDTFANAGAITLANSLDGTKDLPLAVKTGFASITAGGFRIFMMPLDAWKTNMQVHGKAGVSKLLNKISTFPNKGPANLWGWASLYHGALAAASATTVGHWPWFVTYNYLDALVGWNDPIQDSMAKRLVRNASIGVGASFVSDVSSNSIRVLKTYRQTALEPIGYLQAVREIRAKSGLFGWEGLFLRGLQTRITSHAINSAVFTVAWKYFQQL